MRAPGSMPRACEVSSDPVAALVEFPVAPDGALERHGGPIGGAGGLRLEEVGHRDLREAPRLVSFHVRSSANSEADNQGSEASVADSGAWAIPSSRRAKCPSIRVAATCLDPILVVDHPQARLGLEMHIDRHWKSGALAHPKIPGLPPLAEGP